MRLGMGVAAVVALAVLWREWVVAEELARVWSAYADPDPNLAASVSISL